MHCDDDGNPRTTMNEDNSKSEPELQTVIQESIAAEKQLMANTFEWPTDEKDSTHEEDFANRRNRQEHLASWAIFWIVTWTGTTVAGGLFGGALGLIGLAETIFAPLLGFVYGAMWAGGTGLFIFLHIGVVCWTFWWLGRPIVVATVAGLVVGLICGVLVFSLITGPMGAVGAYLTGNQFLKSEAGKTFQATIKSAKEQSAGHLKFTTTDLLLRMTVISMMIAGWTGWFKAF